MILPTELPTTSHLFTVDVEEYFQVSAFEGVVTRDRWPEMPSRLAQSVRPILEQLDRFGVVGTFFTLGWVAKHHPEIVREIASAGHEVASHGFWHRRVTTISPAMFREDLRSSKAALEDVIAAPVTGYRAPSFSIVPGGEWAFDVLIEEGFRYDSSLFPIRRKGYGYPSAPRFPYEIHRPSGMLMEFPLATATFGPVRLPAAGGGYLRQLPFGLIRRAFSQASRRGESATFYIHPWEVDPEQPRLPVGRLTRLRHYRGLGAVSARIEQLLGMFHFTSIASYMNRPHPRSTAA
jgi:polysaccharide deacetylase family protein (PEP-CTERM system associated)